VNLALNRMRLALKAGVDTNVRLADLARAAAVTEKHLCRMFQRALGYPPMMTFRLLKLQLALALLERSNLTIKEIAARCGFENALYFTRCFSQTYGAPPTAVRESMRRREAPPRSPLPPEIAPRLYW
jgi:transcriptional regulator GlxA family with amidase domain